MGVENCSEKLAPFIQNREGGDRNTEKCNLGRNLDRKDKRFSEYSGRHCMGRPW